ncbi:MAG: hypothetical protein IPP04_06445 [Saprospiraceae bacterium]|nr:hypothetical protein [Saprospiraceae bacterium]
MIENRNKTIEIVKHTSADLRAHFTRHPSFGNLDAYQWTLNVSAHYNRHVEQILEISEH